MKYFFVFFTEEVKINIYVIYKIMFLSLYWTFLVLPYKVFFYGIF